MRRSCQHLWGKVLVRHTELAQNSLVSFKHTLPTRRTIEDQSWQRGKIGPLRPGRPECRVDPTSLPLDGKIRRLGLGLAEGEKFTVSFLQS